MRGGSGVGAWVLVGLLLLLHFALHPILSQWPAGPDLLLGGLLLGSLRMRAGQAAGLGFLLGLLEASMALTGLGVLMFVFTLTGYVVARLRDLFYSDSARFVPTFLLVGVWLVQMVVAALTSWPPDASFMLIHAPLAAVATAIVCWVGERIVSFFFV
jgi:cell shape-determining protein MreD